MSAQPVVFLFDVDNTLLDNDRVTADLKKHLDREVGRERALHYWQIFESLRSELGYADYPHFFRQYERVIGESPNETRAHARARANA